MEEKKEYIIELFLESLDKITIFTKEHGGNGSIFTDDFFNLWEQR